MQLVNVIPISRGIGNKETLSYFTAGEVTLGSLISVEVRKKKIKALVVSAEDVIDAKSKIRSSSFIVKKIDKLSSRPFLSPAFIRAAQRTAEYFATTTGAVLGSVISKNILENEDKIGSENFEKSGTTEGGSAAPSRHEKFVIQASNEDRYGAYKSHVREAFARGHSVFIVAPSNESTTLLKTHLERGIERYVISLQSDLKPKVFLEKAQIIKTEEHPLLMIGTAPFLGLCREDVQTIIIENESAGGYKTLRRPFIDLRIFAEFLAEEKKLNLVFGDLLISVETFGRFNKGELSEWSQLKFRLGDVPAKGLVDMKQYKQSSGTSFRIFSDDLIKMIERALEKKENIFLFAARKGLAPITLCSDCGQVVNCSQCSAPVVLHKSRNAENSNDQNYFLCHHCGHKRSALEKCANCGGWRLTSLGIGIEKVEGEIKERFPKATVFRLDKDSASTEKKAKDVIKKFEAMPGSILIGTEMALFYFRDPITYSAVVSMDSLFSIPDFRISEKILHLLVGIQSLTGKELLIQTRDPEQEALKSFFQNSLRDFFKEELAQRERFGYPPFKTLIKITMEGKKATVAAEMAKIEKMFADYNPYLFPAFISTISGNFILHVLIKTDRSSWPNEDLLQKLISLPPYLTVKVDPESLL